MSNVRKSYGYIDPKAHESEMQVRHGGASVEEILSRMDYAWDKVRFVLDIPQNHAGWLSMTRGGEIYSWIDTEHDRSVPYEGGDS